MTDPISVAVASVTATLAFVIGWKSWPSLPDLDGERWFKVILTQVVTGENEAREATSGAWMSDVIATVPYHPAGKFPERKIAGIFPGVMEPAERALHERLAAQPTYEQRWAVLYDTDEAGLAARLDDPHELGSAYDPSGVLGPAGTWDQLVDWAAGKAPGFAEVVGRSLDVRWVLVEGRAIEGVPDVLTALEQLVPRTQRFVYDGLTELTDPLPEDRFVFVGVDAGIQRILRTLAANPGLRDHTRAVISVGGIVQGISQEEELGERQIIDWMGANFGHHRLDTESASVIPYFSLQWLDRRENPPGAFGITLSQARFPKPVAESMTPEAVDAIDLGVLPSNSDPARVAKALWVFVACWVGARSL